MQPEDPQPGEERVSDFRAAEYVRMSTEHQQYSTQNQADKIREYAARRGMPLMLYVFSDGSISASGQVDNTTDGPTPHQPGPEPRQANAGQAPPAGG